MRIKHYIDIQNIRYHNKIHTEYTIADDILGNSIPKLLLQPMVENAIFHGLEPKLGEWRICIAGWKRDNAMIFEIIDNGVGIDVDKYARGYGIHNVAERIRLEYGDTGGFEIEGKPGEGTRIRILIPMGRR